jgi:hypothetical protein
VLPPFSVNNGSAGQPAPALIVIKDTKAAALLPESRKRSLQLISNGKVVTHIGVANIQEFRR